jgi:NAD(P)-dependent dehydrogenase (short-subunit alcohol dehydrogenase family)
MKDFRDRVAVVTGAASGIGLGIARRCAKEGMKTVMADIEEDLLLKEAGELQNAGGDVTPVTCDVSKLEDIQNLAAQTTRKYGGVNLLFNNAGVIPGTNVTKNTILDFQWVIGVNLWGVIYGVHTFLPIMLEQGDECYVVNTSAGSGFISGNGAYDITKYGVNALSESLSIELKRMNANVKVALLIPGIVDTGIVDSNRNRPTELKNPSRGTTNRGEINKRLESIRDRYRGSMSPDLVADMAFDAMKKETFYVFTEMAMKKGVEVRHDSIMSGFDSLERYLKENPLNP